MLPSLFLFISYQIFHIKLLAVAIGTAHGVYKTKPVLDFVRLKEINDVCSVPLVLHGGSGTPDEDIRKIVDEENVKVFVENLNKKYGTKNVALYGDITKAEDVDNIINKGIELYGGVDILVNNAGVWPTDYVKDMSDEAWDKTIKINLSAPFYFSKRVVNHFIEKGKRGKIINIVSQAAFHGSTSGHAHYAAAKGGLVTFTVSLAREVAKYGINVTAVAPGMMRTPMNTQELAEREEEYVKKIPLGRISDPMEVAYAVTFLASDKADYITGATIDVTGGMLMR